MERQPEDLRLVIIRLAEHKDPLYTQTGREMFISGRSKAATGSRERTDPGHRSTTQDQKFKILMHSK
jgi:hypothetical protein